MNAGQELDYIVVGAGTAGSVVASRLSEDPATSVIVLEAGGSDRTPAAATPSEWMTLPGSGFDWDFASTPQRMINRRTIKYPRGKAVGGSSMINAMMHVLPHPEDFAAWPASVDGPTWTHETLLPYLINSASCSQVGRNDFNLGSSAPLRVAAEPLNALTEAALPAFRSIPHAWAGVFPLAIVDDKRETVADAYLGPSVLTRPNLDLRAQSTALRLVFENDETRCTGVEYRDADGAEHLVTARKEVVVCAGVIGTPHLLMVSGIGDRAALADLGVNAVAHAPEVGQNLHDHPLLITIYGAHESLPGAPQRILAGVTTFSEEGLSQPDLQLFVMHSYSGEGDHALCVAVSVLTPRSRGSVRPINAAVTTPPLIDLALLEHDDDLKRLTAGVRLARQLIRETALGDFAASPELVPGVQDGETDQQLGERLRHGVGTYWHGVGTARMGSDNASVVDPSLKVRGVDHLRIVDASVIPTIVGANTNATVLAIAERACSLISSRSRPRL